MKFKKFSPIVILSKVSQFLLKILQNFIQKMINNSKKQIYKTVPDTNNWR